jgi:carnosine synthase
LLQQVKAIVLDGPDSWAQLMQREGTIAKFCPIDFSDAEHVFENCRKVRALLTRYWVSG